MPYLYIQIYIYIIYIYIIYDGYNRGLSSAGFNIRKVEESVLLALQLLLLLLTQLALYK